MTCCRAACAPVLGRHAALLGFPILKLNLSILKSFCVVCPLLPGVILVTHSPTPLRTHADCIFTDWAGDRSPMTIIYGSSASIVDSVFRNMDLTSEIADVSNDGLVRFANTALSNVTLHAGAIVSTTINDYNEVPNFFVFYYAEDDAAYDVDWEPVAVGERGMFGEEFLVEDDLLGDCVYLGAEPEDLRPGCPPESLQQRAAVLLRAQESGSGEESGYGEGATSGPGVEDLPTLADPWLAERLAELRPLPPPPPAWPPFAVVPRDNPENRTELTQPAPVPAGLLVPPLQETPAAVSAASAAVAAAAAGGGGSAIDGRVLVVAVLAVLAAIAVSAVAWALLALRALQRRPRRRGDPGGMLEARQRRRMRDWMWDGGTTVRCPKPMLCVGGYTSPPYHPLHSRRTCDTRAGVARCRTHTRRE